MTTADEPRAPGGAARLYALALGEDDVRLCRDIPEAACRDQPVNFVVQAAANALSKFGDGLADAKVVLPWLLGTLGAPGYLIGLLVPVRESLSLFPQLLIGAAIRRFPVRKWFWAAGSLVEGLCMLAMAGLLVAGVEGAAAGWAVIGLLALFSLARGVCSIAAKDTLGKTVSKSRRGRVNGLSAAAAGVLVGAVGIWLVLAPAAERGAMLPAMIVGAGLVWLAAAAIFVLVREEPGATGGARSLFGSLAGEVREAWTDPELRRFLVARTLLLGSALAGPVYVSLAERASGGEIGVLGQLVVVSGLAGALSSTVWGRLSDRSSRRTMAWASGLAGGTAAVVAAAELPAPRAAGVGLPVAGVFVLGVAHAGVRIGRKTHLVDMAGGDRRTSYVAVSNTAIGIALLAVGAVVGIVMTWSAVAALALLAALSLAGVAVTLRLAEVQG